MIELTFNISFSIWSSIQQHWKWISSFIFLFSLNLIFHWNNLHELFFFCCSIYRICFISSLNYISLINFIFFKDNFHLLKFFSEKRFNEYFSSIIERIFPDQQNISMIRHKSFFSFDYFHLFPFRWSFVFVKNLWQTQMWQKNCLKWINSIDQNILWKKFHFETNKWLKFNSLCTFSSNDLHISLEQNSQIEKCSDENIFFSSRCFSFNLLTIQNMFFSTSIFSFYWFINKYLFEKKRSLIFNRSIEFISSQIILFKFISFSSIDKSFISTDFLLIQSTFFLFLHLLFIFQENESFIDYLNWFFEEQQEDSLWYVKINNQIELYFQWKSQIIWELSDNINWLTKETHISHLPKTTSILISTRTLQQTRSINHWLNIHLFQSKFPRFSSEEIN